MVGEGLHQLKFAVKSSYFVPVVETRVPGRSCSKPQLGAPRNAMIIILK